MFSVQGCSDPLSVRSVAFCLPLAAERQTSPLRHGFHFRVTVVFSSVLRTPQKNYQVHCRNPACSVQQIPNTLYLFLVFAEYTLILFPILPRKHSCCHMSGTVVICQEQSRSTLRTLLRTALPLSATVLLSLIGSCLYRHLY